MQTLFGGSQGQGSSTPVNLQNPAYTALAPGVASGLSSIFGNTTGNPGSGFNLAPWLVNGQSSAGPNNPLNAQMTPQEGSILGQIGGFAQNPFQSAGANFNPAQTLQRMLDPNYASNLASSPQTGAAISAAVNPIELAFNQQTLPGLASASTQAGQRVNAGSNQGSSAFSRAAGEAQAAEAGQIGQVSGGIANQAYQTGLQQQSAAVGQAQALSTSNLNNLVNSLSASALPRLIQQYGIQNGMQLFQQQMSTILQSLALAGQVSQPAIGNQASSSFSSSPGLVSSLFGNQGLGSTVATLAPYLGWT